MAIEKINFHYPKGTLQSVFEGEALTALELASKTSKKVDECIEIVNGVEQTAIEATAIVDDMYVIQNQFVTDNSDTRSQLINDNQQYLDGLTASKTQFETGLTEDLNTFKEGLETSKTNFETDLNNEVDLIVNNAETLIETNVNNKITDLVNDGTIDGLINVDTQKAIAEITGFGVLNGLNVIPQAIPNMSVLIAPGIAHLFNGKRYEQLDNKTINIDVADPLYDRIDIIYINASGVMSYGKGEAKAIPTAPTPLNGLIIAEVSVSKTTTVINAGNISDKRPIKYDIETAIIKNVDEITYNIKNFGAIGDGLTDDTIAIQSALTLANEKGKSVFIPVGTYLITEPLTIKANVKFYGAGEKSIIKKVNATGRTIDGTNINSVLIVEGHGIAIENMMLSGGEVSNNINGITFNDCFESSFNRLKLTKFFKAFHDFKTVWMTEFNKITCQSCENGFSFNNSVAKTSLTFKTCWAENCGQSYNFKEMVYSNLISCAADWNSYIDNNPYGQGYGNQATEKAVYHFELCHSISMKSCGCEYCFGNGVVYSNSGEITIDGLTIYGFKSDYVPNYVNEPNWGVGIITTGQENTIMNISNLYIDGMTFKVQTTNPTKPVSLIANNYSEGAYGVKTTNTILLFASRITTSIPLFAGKNGAKNCLYVPDMMNKIVVNDYIDMGYSRKFKSIALSLAGGGSKILIPVIAQGNQNRVHTITLKIINNQSNGQSANMMKAEVSFSSLNTVSNVSVDTKGTTDGITAMANGANVQISLPASYSALLVECEVLSRDKTLVDFLNATLTL